MSLEKYSRRMIEVLKENDIPFTIHWGKNSDWELPGLLKHMFNGNSEKWIEQRKKLLSTEMQDMFSNKFITTIGLH